MNTFSTGSLVEARDREWVVLPGSSSELMRLRPISGTDAEETTILTALEDVKEARFEFPDIDHPGDFRSSNLLRDAVRLGFRSGAGPFRSFASIAVDPRPYQVVPLLMALKQDPVRLLIADDVGIGKTVEACLIAKELLERGEIQRMSVLCPPHLAEQWRDELWSKFHIRAELVLPGKVRKLEQEIHIGQTLFEVHSVTIVSLDYIKSDKHRNDFVRTCPELVIIDEAHTCVSGFSARNKHQRYELVRKLAEDPERNLVLVTATPHSGNEDAFRSLLVLLNPDFANLPVDISGKQHEAARRRVSNHFIQRRRPDIKDYLEENTTFPVRTERDETYSFTPAYSEFFHAVLDYCREKIKDPLDSKYRERIRWWSLLALLRCCASSPAAAAATLRARCETLSADTEEDADNIGRRKVLDQDGAEDSSASDAIPGADTGEEEQSVFYNTFAERADKLLGKEDAKLQKLIQMLKRLLKDGFHPIVFCRYIETAEYVSRELSKALPRAVTVESITGKLAPEDREVRVRELGKAEKRVLVATDCLSEGINLQDSFTSVVHYDLSWNPTRHEQREGRVDRFGQESKEVRVITYYGKNEIDGMVLEVLLKKHRTIRTNWGISVPIPMDSGKVMESLIEGLLLKKKNSLSGGAEKIDFLTDLGFDGDGLAQEWEYAADREKKSRTMFAHDRIKVEEVRRELQAAREAVGSWENVRDFVEQAMGVAGALYKKGNPVKLDWSESPRSLKDLLPVDATSMNACWKLPVRRGEQYLSRSHPFVESLCRWVLTETLDPESKSPARRCGVIRTKDVDIRTTLLLLRLRHHIEIDQEDKQRTLLAEEAVVVAFQGSPDSPQWLADEDVNQLQESKPSGNIDASQARSVLAPIQEALDGLQPHLNQVADKRAEALLDAHRRVREQSKHKGRYKVRPNLPADLLGVYVYLPVAKGLDL